MKNQTFLNHSELGYGGREGRSQKNSNLSDEVIRSKKIRSYALVRRSGWCQYSRSCGWFVNRLFLVGKDTDSGWFSVQVPSSLDTVEEAVQWMKPAAVKKAEAEGRQVVRQGDFFFFQTVRKTNLAEKLSKLQWGGLNLNPDHAQSHQVRKTESGYEIFHIPGQHDVIQLNGHNWNAAQRKAIIARGD